MVVNTSIEWATHTFNPWEGCQKVGPGCDHCYAEARNARFGGGIAPNWGPGAPRRRTSAANWRQPLTWNREAERAGIRPRVFCASLADVFDNAVAHEWREDLFALIDATPHLDWLLLTKRIGNVPGMLMAQSFSVLPKNVWLGATVVNQAEADRDIPKLLAVPATKRFLSMEPLLEHVDIGRAIFTALAHGGIRYADGDPGTHPISWVIVGGESGPGARPMNPQWARDLRDQCAAADVPFLFKQNGDWVSVSEVEGFQGNLIHEFPDGRCVRRIGKARAGRTLDGVEHNGMPS